jgi:hypothetical protein
MLYNFLAKNNPKSKRHNAAPNGSSITPYNPPLRNSEEAPNTVSEPNHVANNAAELNVNGRLRPANIKSPEVFTLFEAQKPITTVNARYVMMENSNNASVRLFEV